MCEISEELWRIEQLATCLWLVREWTTRESPCEKHKCQKAFCDSSRDLVNPRDASPACFMCFPHFFTHTIKTHITHGIVKRILERTLEIHLRVRDCTLTIIYIFLLVFLYSYFSNYISRWRVGTCYLASFLIRSIALYTVPLHFINSFSSSSYSLYFVFHPLRALRTELLCHAIVHKQPSPCQPVIFKESITLSHRPLFVNILALSFIIFHLFS